MNDIIEVTTYYRPIQKSDRCGRSGRVIKCPMCRENSRVYHLGWSSLSCECCDEPVRKQDWLIQIGEEK